MQTTRQAIRAAALTDRTSKRQGVTQRISLRQLLRAFVAWWADTSMNSRFEQERARDDQVLRRHGGW